MSSAGPGQDDRKDEPQDDRRVDLHDDPHDDGPDDADDPAREWALSLVVRVERDAPPRHTDVLVAAARAVVALLVDRRTTAPHGELHAAVTRWRDGRIRKITRRARGARWERTASLPHVEVTAGTATVRAFAPHPLGAAPAQLQSLQVGGLDLRDGAPGPLGAAEPGPETTTTTGPPAPPTSAPVLTVRLSPDVTMTTGKAAAQVGHAAQLALEDLERSRVFAWLAGGTTVRVLTGAPVLPADERVDVHDGGFTEVAPGTLTASAGFEALDPLE